ncbi:MAG: proton-conducting transporter membrane subunit [Stellaceae bacterium]
MNALAPLPVAGVMHSFLLSLGAASAILGSAAALRQRHMKRLLAFSTIAHAGIMLIGVTLLTARGLGWIRLIDPVLTVVDRLHNGLIGDYAVWIIIGLALFSLSLFASTR